MSGTRRDEARQDDAEAVRAYLVELRGGAPFLSSRDGRLLLRWMEDGVPVAFICQALDRAAEKRRRKRVKTPLSLRNAATAVKKWQGAPEATACGPLAPLVELWRSGGEGRAADALAAVSDLQGAIAVARAELERLWEAADRDALREQAIAELRELELDERALEAASEEVARDLLRQRHPLLSAAVIWDTVRA